MVAPAPQRASDHSSVWWRWACVCASGAAALLGLVVFVGWQANIVPLARVVPGFRPMQYNTSICFMLAGISLSAWVLGERRFLAGVGSAIVALVGALTVAEYVFQADFAIDRLLFHERNYSTMGGNEILLHPGRMSLPSAACFLALGAALLVLVGKPRRWRPSIVGILASFIISLGITAIIGYVCGLPGAYGWGQTGHVAAHSASGFVILGAGLLITVWHAGLHPGERTPRWLPAAFAVSIATASVVVYFALGAKQDAELVRVIRTGTESVHSQIAVRLDARIRSLVRMAARWQTSGGRIEQSAWQDDAEHYIHDSPEMQAIEWIDASHHLRWIAPIVSNQDKIGKDLLTEDRRGAAVAEAERERQPVITRAVTLFHGGIGYVIYVPVSVNEQPDGVLGAVFEVTPLFARYFPPGVATGQAIRISDGDRTVFERDASTPARRPNLTVRDHVDFRGVSWSLEVWPTPTLFGELDDPLPEIVLVAGLFGGILLGAVCYLAQGSSRLERLATRSRDALQHALDEVKTLKGLLPICACCKRIRDDTGYWNQVDTYLHRHTDAKLSHGYCPECAAKAFTEFGLDVPEQVRAQLEAKNFE